MRLLFTLCALIALSTSALFAGGSQDEKIPGITKTGYLTVVNARESELDMPRQFYLLIGEDGEKTLLGFDRYSSKNKGDFATGKFDPRKYLGKTITITFSGAYQSNNKEFNIDEGKKELTVIRKSRVMMLSDLKVEDKQINVAKEYQYPVKDTIAMPHDIRIEHQPYSGKASSQSVNLKDFVSGKGTAENPYISEDGTAGLSRAVSKLKDGGIIEIPAGVFFFTAKNFSIPRFVSLVGAGEDKTTIKFKNTGAWKILGNNTLERFTMDVTIPQKYGYVTQCANNSKDITARNITVVGDYHPDPKAAGERMRNNSTIPFSMGSWVDGFTIEKCKFHNVYRSFVTKGQKQQKNITVRDCLFDGHAYTCISLDQTSGCENILIENCEFRDFSHFGVAFARITDVILRGCTFYSRTLYASAPYNQAIHLEDHCQNFLIENNTIDVILKGHQDTRPEYRSAAVALGDSRFAIVRNNTIRNSNIVSHAGESLIAGFSLIENNTIDNGNISIENNRSVKVINNTLSNPATKPFKIISSAAKGVSCSDIVIEKNTITDFKVGVPLEIKGFVKSATFRDNKISGGEVQPCINESKIPDAKIIIE